MKVVKKEERSGVYNFCQEEKANFYCDSILEGLFKYLYVSATIPLPGPFSEEGSVPS